MSEPERDWYAEWVTSHAQLFGLDRDNELATLLSWRETFCAQGFTAAELRAASLHLARDPPRFREEHLRRLQEVIHGRRAAARRADDLQREAEEGTAWVCPDCRGCGWVSVPHLRFVEGGDWQPDGNGKLVTWAVTCSCNRGRREMELAGEKRRPLTLENYEWRNPDWRRQVAESGRAAAMARQARERAREADRERGRLHRDNTLPF